MMGNQRRAEDRHEQSQPKPQSRSCESSLTAIKGTRGSGFPCHFSHIQIRKKRKKVKSLSRVQLFVTPWFVAYQASPSIGFSRQEYQSGLPFPSPGDLPDPGIKLRSPTLQADALPSEPPGKPRVQSLGWEDLLEKEMATHSIILAWIIPWTEEPGRL